MPVQQQAETSGARLKTAKEESDKLRLANDNLVMQLERANAVRLSEIGKDSLAKSELRQKVAELELSLQSRRGSNGVEEIAEQKEKLSAESKEIDFLAQTLTDAKKEIEGLKEEIEKRGTIHEIYTDYGPVNQLFCRSQPEFSEAAGMYLLNVGTPEFVF